MLIDLIDNDDVSCVSSAAERPLRPASGGGRGSGGVAVSLFSFPMSIKSDRNGPIFPGYFSFSTIYVFIILIF